MGRLVSVISNLINQLAKHLLTHSDPYSLPMEYQKSSVPMEILSLPSDGDPAFASFLESWGVEYCLSSSDYPLSSRKAELGVKTSKQIIINSTSRDGSHNNDSAAKSIMQCHNTSLSHINLSPAQILLHRQLRDHIPSNHKHYKLHTDWIISAEQREQVLTRCNQVITQNYDAKAHPLPDIPMGSTVAIHEQSKIKPNRWSKTGTVVEILPHH